MSGYQDSVEQYKPYVEYMKDFYLAMQSNGLTVKACENEALFDTYEIYINQLLLATIEWNIPYIINFEPVVQQKEKAFSVDYVKNFDDWKEFMEDIRSSLLEVSARDEN